MADPKPPVPPATTSATPPSSATYKAPTQNPALRMMGLPRLRLPSRNWTIFLALVGAVGTAVVHDRREKRRATARWARAVAHLAAEPLPDPNAMPRRLAVVLAAPPGDGLRVAQDHFLEYVKPVLAASGLDWEFVQGRREGDVRAAVAERARRLRREHEVGADRGAETPLEGLSAEEQLAVLRRRKGIRDFKGTGGDIVVGRHAWKEYVRGLHEGWLGPLEAPEPAPAPVLASEALPDIADKTEGEGEKKEGEEEQEKKEDRPSRPKQPPPYNTTTDYPSSPLPRFIPAEFNPTTPLVFPHILGFLNTPTRMYRFFNRRKLADDIGREVAAVCLCTHREYRDESEQQDALVHEEADWVKKVWKGTPPEDGEEATSERIWASPVVVDPRISMRMRRFQLEPDEELRVRSIIVPEEEIEGRIKGSLRAMWRWGAGKFGKKGASVEDLE